MVALAWVTDDKYEHQIRYKGGELVQHIQESAQGDCSHDN